MWFTLQVIVFGVGQAAPAAPQGGQPALPERVRSPSDAVRAAGADILRHPPHARPYLRYFDLGSYPLGVRGERIKVLSGHLNGLSLELLIKPPAVLGGTEGSVLRINLLDYGGAFAAAWERLDSPYQHLTVEEVRPWRGGTYSDGRYYAAGSFRVRKRVKALAPWLTVGPEGAVKDPATVRALEALARETGSEVPLVSGRWFLWQTAVQEGRGDTGYYDFSGAKDLKTFQRLIRFDADAARRLEHYRVVTWSGVTQEPRRIELDLTVLGGYWHTKDSAEAVGRKNPLNVTDNTLKFDATEQIAAGPNGMMRTFLANGAGVRQDKAPDSIVGGERRTHKDLRLQVNLDCIHCHFSGKRQGIIDPDFTPVARLTAADYSKYGNSDKVYRELQEHERRYYRDRALQAKIRQDRATYATAVFEATGMECGEYGAAYTAAYAEHDEARVDLRWAARDLGVTPQALKTGLAAQGYKLINSLTLILNGGALPVRQWEEVLPLAHQYARGLVLPREWVPLSRPQPARGGRGAR